MIAQLGEQGLENPSNQIDVPVIVSQPARSPRVLLVAYACDPCRGSEGGVGWNRAVQAARFFDTTVICEETEFAEGVRRRLRERGEIPGLQFHFIPQRRWESHLWRVPGLGYLAYNLWQRRAFRLAQRLHAEQAFDLVHQVNFTTYREPGYLWKLDAPFIWGPFGGTQNCPWRYRGRGGMLAAAAETVRAACNGLQLRMGRRLRRSLHRAALVLTCNSTAQRDFARVHGVTPELFPDTGITAIPDAPRADRRGGPLRILWAGQLIPRKAMDLLIEALARVPDDVRWEVRVVGDGPEKGRWQRLARRRGVDGHITWTGWIPHREMPEQYGWADVFAFTSVRDNMGTVVLEAMGAGLPVLCLDHQGAHDAVTDSCGIKIPVVSPQDTIGRFTAAIDSLARQPQRCRELGRAAKERAKEYLWSRQGEAMAALYRRVLERADRRVEPTPAAPEHRTEIWPVSIILQHGSSAMSS